MITYCTNIHPGESWAATFSNLKNCVPAVKKAVAPGEPFPIGLRLSNQASLEVDPDSSVRFGAWCREENCYVATINGFPYGSFHGQTIKERVYLPDWRAAERVDYTRRLASLLDAWLPPDVAGSISTVPVAFKTLFSEDDYPLVRQNLTEVLIHLDRLRQKSGKQIILALEPEPGCVLETTPEVVRFFERMRFARELHNAIGICLDCCHQAVEFESPQESLSLLSQAGIPIAKVQVSSAPRILRPKLETLQQFIDPCYLHQVVVRHKDGTRKQYPDLPEALDDYHQNTAGEWRIHFHVPVFIDTIGDCRTTRFFLEEVLARVDKRILLEIETYTWHILPPELQTKTVIESIIREIRWVRSILNLN
ncbi:MAG: metabolite traffic protein EboE [Desulfobacterales bacterium]|nr:metabolite traffic protein EboE [Desulfobacterales bacterium]